MSSISELYLRFLENQMDRASNAYRRSSTGQYHLKEWFGDVTECGADIVNTMWGPVKDVLDSEMRWEVTAAPKEKNVRDSRRCSVNSNVLTVTPLKCSGKADIAFTAGPTANGRRVNLEIADVGTTAASGEVYIGTIIDPAGGGTVVATVKLKIK